MLPGWDKLQDLRGRNQSKPEENSTDGAVREVRAVTSEKTIKANADRISAFATGIREGKRVSKLGEIGERIAAKKAAHERKADEWAARLDVIDRREPAAFAIGDAVIEEREHDLTDMERSMRALSNLPNVVSGK